MRLSDWLDERGWTDQEAAHELGLHRETVRRYRHCRNSPNPHPATVDRIVKASNGRVTARDLARKPKPRADDKLRLRKRKG